MEAAGLSRRHFGPKASSITSVLTVDGPDLGFHAIGRESGPEISSRAARWRTLMSHLTPLGRGTAMPPQGPASLSIWKVFSLEPMAEGQARVLFDQVGRLRRRVWDHPGAYPVLSPDASWPSFDAGPGLIYAGAMESAVSCMETQAISGRNAALLAARHVSSLAAGR